MQRLFCSLAYISLLKKKDAFKFAFHLINVLYAPSIVNRTQSNCISIELNRTKSNSIHELSLIEFGNRTKSNSHKNNWTIEPNQTFDF